MSVKFARDGAVSGAWSTGEWRTSFQNEVSTLCHSRESGNPEPRHARGQVWMPAFAGMTLTFLSHPPIVND
jgi:hypothetical protein